MASVLDLVIRARKTGGETVGQVEQSVKRLDDAAAQAARNGLSQLNRSFGTLQVTMGNLLANGIERLTSGLFDWVKGTVWTASWNEEMASQFDVVFGDLAEQTREHLAQMADDMNRSRFDIAEYAAAFQNIFVPMGYTREAARDMSVELAGLTFDLASFNDVAEANVMADLRTTLIGNHEAMQKYGVVLNETVLKEELARMGSEELTGAALEQAKVQARLNIILDRTADAHGDAARTAGSFSNVMRGLQAAILDFRSGIGEALLPALTPFMQAIADFIREVGPKFVEWFSNVVEAVSNWAIDVGLYEKLSTAGSAVTAFGETMQTLLDIFGQAIRDGFVWTDTINQLPESLRGPVTLISDLIIFVRELALQFWDFIEPLRTWITENVQLSDVLIALGIVLGGLIVGPLAGILTAVGKVVLAFGGLTLAVTLVRKAWEEDFLGIRTLITDLVEALSFRFRLMVSAFRDHGEGALREIATFITGGETNFYHLAQLLDKVWYIIRKTVGDIARIVGERLVVVWEQLREWGEDLVGWVSQRFPSWAEAWGRWAAAAWTWLRDTAVPNTTQWLGNLWGAFSGWLGTHLGEWGTKFTEWGAAAWLWLANIAVPQVVQWLSTLWRKFSEWFGLNGPTLRERLGTWASNFWTWLRDTAVPKVVEWLGNAWRAIAGWFGENGPTLVSNLATWAGNFWTWLRDTAVPKIGEWLGNAWRSITGWFTEHGPTLLSQVGKWAEHFWTWLRDTAAPKIGEWLGNLWDGIWRFLTGPNFSNLVVQLGVWGAKVWQWVRDAIPETAKKIEAWWREIKGKLDHYQPILESQMKTWQDLLTDVFGKESEKDLETKSESWFTQFWRIQKEAADSLDIFVINALADLVEGITFGIAESIKAFGKWLSDGIKYGFNIRNNSEADQLLRDANERLLSAMLGFLVEIGKAIGVAAWEVGKAALQGIWNGLTGREDRTRIEREMERVASDTIGAAKDGFDTHSPSRALKMVGMDVLRGLLEGVSDWPLINSILNKVRGIGRDAINAIRTVTGTHSPSTEMIEVAKGWIDGLLYGSRAGENQVYASMSLLGQNIIASLLASTGDLGTLLGDSIHSAIESALGEARDSIDRFASIGQEAAIQLGDKLNSTFVGGVRASEMSASSISSSLLWMVDEVEKKLKPGDWLGQYINQQVREGILAGRVTMKNIGGAGTNALVDLVNRLGRSISSYEKTPESMRSARYGSTEQSLIEEMIRIFRSWREAAISTSSTSSGNHTTINLTGAGQVTADVNRAIQILSQLM